MIVIVLHVWSEKSLNRVGAPHGLAAFPCSLVLVLRAYGKTHDPVVCLWVAPCSLSLYIFKVGDAGQVFGEHEHEHVFITNTFICICTTMDWPSILATARDEEEDLDNVRVATCLFALGTHQSPN